MRQPTRGTRPAADTYFRGVWVSNVRRRAHTLHPAYLFQGPPSRAVRHSLWPRKLSFRDGIKRVAVETSHRKRKVLHAVEHKRGPIDYRAHTSLLVLIRLA